MLSRLSDTERVCKGREAGRTRRGACDGRQEEGGRQTGFSRGWEEKLILYRDKPQTMRSF